MSIYVSKQVATVLHSVPGFDVNINEVETNMIVLKFDQASGINSQVFIEKCKTRGVQMLARGDFGVRLVIHRDLSEDDIEHGVLIMQQIAGELTGRRV